MYKEIGIENIIGGLFAYNTHKPKFQVKELKCMTDSIRDSDEFVRIRSISESIEYIKDKGCIIEKGIITIPISLKDDFMREYYKVDRNTRELFKKLARNPPLSRKVSNWR